MKQLKESENKGKSEFLEKQKEKEKTLQENEFMKHPQYVSLPFAQKMKRKKLDKQFSMFFEILKKSPY